MPVYLPCIHSSLGVLLVQIFLYLENFESERDKRDWHHDDEQHQHGRRDRREIHDGLTGVPRVHALEQYPYGLLVRVESTERIRAPLQRTEHEELDPDEPEDSSHQQLAMVLGQQVEVPDFRGVF